jgi:hypothetical protein
MLASEIAGLYDRDLRRLIEEIGLFKNDENLWKTHGAIKNSSGTLVLHIIGGLNHLIGATLAHTGYERRRELEFTNNPVERTYLVNQLENLLAMVTATVKAMTPKQIDASYPQFFDKDNATNSYVLTQLLLHLNYHLGQVNYLRRALEA